MRNKYTLISLIVGMALILAACVGASDNDDATPGVTDVMGTETLETPLATLEETPLATEEVTVTVEATEPVTATQGIPGTGAGSNVAIEDFGLICDNLANFNVYSKSNEELGEVDDLVINVRSGRIMYLVVDAEGGGRVLVPWGVVSIVPTTSTTTGGPLNDLQLSVDADTFKNAPKTADDDFLEDAVDGWDVDFDAYWKTYFTPGQNEPGTGNSPNTPASVMNFGLACKDFADFDLVSSDGEKVGEVEDLVLDVQSKHIAYLVVDKEDSDDLVLVPWSALTIVKGKSTTLLGITKNEFQLSVDAAAFNSAPTYTDVTEFNLFDVDWDADLRAFWKDFVKTPVTP